MIQICPWLMHLNVVHGEPHGVYMWWTLNVIYGMNQTIGDTIYVEFCLKLQTIVLRILLNTENKESEELKIPETWFDRFTLTKPPLHITTAWLRQSIWLMCLNLLLYIFDRPVSFSMPIRGDSFNMSWRYFTIFQGQ